jgi:hypothetical protein
VGAAATPKALPECALLVTIPKFLHPQKEGLMVTRDDRGAVFFNFQICYWFD